MHTVTREKVEFDPLFNPGDIFKVEDKPQTKIIKPLPIKSTVSDGIETIPIRDFLDGSNPQSPLPQSKSPLLLPIVSQQPHQHSTPTFFSSSSISVSESTSILPKPSTEDKQKIESPKNITESQQVKRKTSNLFEDEIDFVKQSAHEHERQSLEKLVGTTTNKQVKTDLFSEGDEQSTGRRLQTQTQTQTPSNPLEGIYIPKEAIVPLTNKIVNTGLDKDMLNIPAVEIDVRTKASIQTAMTTITPTTVSTSTESKQQSTVHEDIDDDLFDLVDTKQPQTDETSPIKTNNFEKYIKENQINSRGGDLFSQK